MTASRPGVNFSFTVISAGSECVTGCGRATSLPGWGLLCGTCVALVPEDLRGLLIDGVDDPEEFRDVWARVFRVLTGRVDMTDNDDDTTAEIPRPDEREDWQRESDAEQDAAVDAELANLNADLANLTPAEWVEAGRIAMERAARFSATRLICCVGNCGADVGADDPAQLEALVLRAGWVKVPNEDGVSWQWRCNWHPGDPVYDAYAGAGAPSPAESLRRDWQQRVNRAALRREQNPRHALLEDLQAGLNRGIITPDEAHDALALGHPIDWRGSDTPGMEVTRPRVVDPQKEPLPPAGSEQVIAAYDPEDDRTVTLTVRIGTEAIEISRSWSKTSEQDAAPVIDRVTRLAKLYLDGLEDQPSRLTGEGN